jgi:hypothetical protein
MTKHSRLLAAKTLAKRSTGVRGLDQIADGGLPRNRSEVA